MMVLEKELLGELKAIGKKLAETPHDRFKLELGKAIAGKPSRFWKETKVLDVALTQSELTYSGNFVYVLKLDGICNLQFNSTNDAHSPQIPLSEGMIIKGPIYHILYLTAASQAGKTLTLLGGFDEDIDISSGNKVRLITAAGDEITDDAADAVKAILQASSAIIGKVGIDQTTPGTTNLVATSVVKTIQTELLAITAIAADVQQLSSELALTSIKGATIFIDHGRDNANAAIGAGTEYRIEVSEKASGNDTWQTIASVVCDITAPSSIVTDGQEVAGSTVIECGATVPALGAIMFFKNATIANSEWVKVVARVTTGGSESFTIQQGLTNTQAQGTYYNGAQQFAPTLDVRAFTRLRVVVNNNNGTTNRAIVSRIAAITYV